MSFMRSLRAGESSEEAFDDVIVAADASLDDVAAVVDRISAALMLAAAAAVAARCGDCRMELDGWWMEVDGGWMAVDGWKEDGEAEGDDVAEEVRGGVPPSADIIDGEEFTGLHINDTGDGKR